MRHDISGPALKVQPWRGPAAVSAAALRPGSPPLVLGIATPDGAVRDAAREAARTMLRGALSVLLKRPPEAVPLVSRPGHPVRLDLPGTRIGLSVSHERGLTIAAIHPGGPVGVDLMRVEQRPGWLPDWESVARDYLGRESAHRIGELPPAERPCAFAAAWTGLEAGLKCHGMPLQEWNPAREATLMRCTLFRLDLPHGFIGTLAACA